MKSHGEMIVAQAKELYRLGGEMEAMKTQLAQQPPPTVVYLFKADIYVTGSKTKNNETTNSSWKIYMIYIYVSIMYNVRFAGILTVSLLL